MQIRIVSGARSIDATLADNATARDFAALLPLTLTLEDHAATEKIGMLPRNLSTAGAPEGIDPEIGDIAYHAPRGNLAIFHRDFGHSSGLIRLGRIAEGAEAFAATGKQTRRWRAGGRFREQASSGHRQPTAAALWKSKPLARQALQREPSRFVVPLRGLCDVDARGHPPRSSAGATGLAGRCRHRSDNIGRSEVWRGHAICKGDGRTATIVQWPTPRPPR
jgi:hypothetical protein